MLSVRSSFKKFNCKGFLEYASASVPLPSLAAICRSDGLQGHFCSTT